MKHFDVFEAQTHFSELLEKVVNGEKFIITKYGVQVAMVIPFAQKEEGIDPVKDAIRALKKLREEVVLGKKLSIKKIIEEGRE
jgi:prevent-host-death family protein